MTPSNRRASRPVTAGHSSPSHRPRTTAPLANRLASAPPRLVTEPPEAGLVIHYAAPGCVIGHVRNMTFSAWNTAPTVPHIEAFMALAEQLSATYALNSNVTLVYRDTSLPGDAAREALEELTAKYARVIHSVALVIDGAGFWASMIRSFLTGLHVLRGNGYRCKAFATPAEANPWLLPPHFADTGVALTEQAMQAACDAVAARMKLEGKPRG